MYDTSAKRPQPAEFQFRGSAREWFGIWITNLLLSIVTFGIYSAWAKVRRKKYFYQNTWVAGRNFDYHATGMQILIGRAIVLVGALMLTVLASIPEIAAAVSLAFLVLVPWLIVRALRFNAAMSSWANVRFRFQGSTLGAFLVTYLYPVLAALTLFVAWPFADRARRRFSVGGHRLGAADFDFRVDIGVFYLALLAAGIWVAGVALVLGVATAPLLGPALAAGTEPGPAEVGAISAFLLGMVFLGVFPATEIYRASVRNAVFNGTTLDGIHRFRSDVNPAVMVWIVLSNAVAVMLTLGLLLPWAQIRLARYNAAHTVLLPGGSLDDFLGEMGARTSALGDAFADFEGLDFALPV